MAVFVKNVLNYDCQKMCIWHIIDLIHLCCLKCPKYDEIAYPQVPLKQIQTYLTGYFKILE